MGHIAASLSYSSAIITRKHKCHDLANHFIAVTASLPRLDCNSITVTAVLHIQ
jgi:hypothetical protein